jgi:1-phosphofructokinase/tagatose 6-phosphate kinase
VAEAELELFVDKLLYLAKGAAVCVFSGSLPRGIPDELYARLISEINRLGVLTVLDSEGEALRLGTKAEPGIVTPNEPEAEELVGHEFSDDDDRAAAMHEIVDLGAAEALMTLPSGCLAFTRDGHDHALYSARIDAGVVESRSTVGSGDAFLAGMVAARYGGRSAEDCLRFAVACGAESVQHFGAGVLDPREVDRLLPEVRVDRLAEPAMQGGS